MGLTFVDGQQVPSYMCVCMSECGGGGGSMKICDIATYLAFLLPETVRCHLLSELDVVLQVRVYPNCTSRYILFNIL